MTLPSAHTVWRRVPLLCAPRTRAIRSNDLLCVRVWASPDGTLRAGSLPSMTEVALQEVSGAGAGRITIPAVMDGTVIAAIHHRLVVSSAVAVTVIVMAASAAVAQDGLDAARELYNGARYEEALVRLDGLRGSRHVVEEVRSIEQYRAFCLLALGRTAEAERAMEAVVTTAPSYRPAVADESPRVRAVFSDVRRRVLPRIIQEQYAQAKAALDRRDTAAATAGFQLVLELLADPDIASLVNQPPLADLRTMAAGFRDLSARSAPPRAPAAAASSPAATVAPAVAREPAPAPTPAVAPRRSPPRVYGLEDANVVPPTVMRESWAELADVFAVRAGVVEIVIDETGAVSAATMTTGVNVVYDRLALATAKRWRYRPATLDGVPVKFRKAIPLDPTSTR